jgi:hypothetical protein
VIHYQGRGVADFGGAPAAKRCTCALSVYSCNTLTGGRPPSSTNTLNTHLTSGGSRYDTPMIASYDSVAATYGTIFANGGYPRRNTYGLEAQPAGIGAAQHPS